MSATKKITVKDFPMLYLAEPISAQELISKISNVEVVKIANEYPRKLIERDKVNELRSYVRVIEIPIWPEFMEEWV